MDWDQEFLRSLDSTIIESPASNDFLTRQTLLFVLHVQFGVIFASPKHCTRSCAYKNGKYDMYACHAGYTNAKMTGNFPEVTRPSHIEIVWRSPHHPRFSSSSLLAFRHRWGRLDYTMSVRAIFFHHLLFIVYIGYCTFWYICGTASISAQVRLERCNLIVAFYEVQPLSDVSLLNHRTFAMPFFSTKSSVNWVVTIWWVINKRRTRVSRSSLNPY